MEIVIRFNGTLIRGFASGLITMGSEVPIKDNRYLFLDIGDIRLHLADKRPGDSNNDLSEIFQVVKFCTSFE
ncbi:hypothetical protein ALC62_02499 [Cyphomyrmex costatus]|uniref:Uncharacterized protein n=1 Tax=Cyphomyrmex costatus TaxID=456900 RepID=A0A195D0I1_9HYME|nr:hypothetical protein ALC62_02499 [Cyphomyrmex costatus]